MTWGGGIVLLCEDLSGYRAWFFSNLPLLLKILLTVFTHGQQDAPQLTFICLLLSIQDNATSGYGVTGIS